MTGDPQADTSRDDTSAPSSRGPDAANGTSPPRPSPTLRDALVARGALSWREALEAALGIARALDAAHGEAPPALHRELTPDTVSLGAGGTVTLLPRARAAASTASGALRYMSPEQIDACPLDVRSDMYVAGVVLYEALAGAPPFASPSPRELMNLQCTADPPPLPDAIRRELPRGAETLLFALLAKDPAARVPTAKELAERLASFLPASGVVPSEAAPPRARRRATRGDSRASGLAAWFRGARAVPNPVVVLAVALLTIAAAVTTYAVRASPAADHAIETVTPTAR